LGLRVTQGVLITYLSSRFSMEDFSEPLADFLGLSLSEKEQGEKNEYDLFHPTEICFYAP